MTTHLSQHNYVIVLNLDVNKDVDWRHVTWQTIEKASTHQYWHKAILYKCFNQHFCNLLDILWANLNKKIPANNLQSLFDRKHCTSRVQISKYLTFTFKGNAHFIHILNLIHVKQLLLLKFRCFYLLCWKISVLMAMTWQQNLKMFFWTHHSSSRFSGAC